MAAQRLRPGGFIVYKITVRNLGTEHASGVEVIDTVPLHTTYEASESSDGWVCEAPIPRCSS